MKKKKRISLKTAKKMAASLNLSAQDRELFVISTITQRSKDGKKTKTAQERMTLLQEKASHLINDQELSHANTWLYMTIIELMSFEEWDQSLEWIAKKLSLPTSNIIKTFQLLEKMGWVRKNGEIYESRFNTAETSDDAPSIPIKEYHKSTLMKAYETLDKQDVLQREFQSMILTFDSAEIVRAKKFIRSFMDDFNNQFGLSKNKNSVYHLGLQFYNLTAPSNKGLSK